MMELFHREAVYLCYYFSPQLSQMFHYWVQRCVLKSALSAASTLGSACIYQGISPPGPPPPFS